MKQIETIHLFTPLSDELIKLLKNLEPSDWLKPSPIKNRTIKDLVSHLLDGSLRKLAIQRDGFEDKSNIPDIKSYEDLVKHIQTLNSDWMNVTKRLSPEILIDLLEYSEKQFNDFIKNLNPNDKALFGVAWAGEFESENWFDIAREYTEKWHHQMQIRLALNKPVLLEPKYSEPLYDTFMRGLPYLYQGFTNYITGYTIKVSISGTLNKSWFVIKDDKNWILSEEGSGNIDSAVEIADDIAWKLFTNTEREKEKYKSVIKITGDEEIGFRILDFIAVMS